MARFFLILSIFSLAFPLAAFTAVRSPDEAWYPERLVIDLETSTEEKHTISYISAYLGTEELTLCSPYDSQILIGGPDEPLWPETEYQLTFVAFDKTDREISRTTLCATTGSWAGTYRWDNPTDRDNKGRCTSIVVQARPGDETDFGSHYYRLFDIREDSEYCFFPIDEKDGDGKYRIHRFDEDSERGETYRQNAERFNTTAFTPSQWQVMSLDVGPTTYKTFVESKAIMVFTVHTENTYIFRINEGTRKKELLFVLDGDGLCKMGLFFNPAPPEEGKSVFVLECVE